MCRSKGEFSHASSLGVNIATVGVAIGVAVMIVSIAVVYGFKNEIKNKVTGFGADIQVVNSDGVQAAENGRVVYSKKFFEDIGHVDGVKHIYTEDEIDYFAFYNLERDRVYLISIKEEGLPKNEVTIRFCLPKTKNQFKTFLEEDYLIDKVIQ